MGAALLTGQKFRALCAFPVENACPLPVGRQEGPPAGARFPAWRKFPCLSSRRGRSLRATERASLSLWERWQPQADGEGMPLPLGEVAAARLTERASPLPSENFQRVCGLALAKPMTAPIPRRLTEATTCARRGLGALAPSPYGPPAAFGDFCRRKSHAWVQGTQTPCPILCAQHTFRSPTPPSQRIRNPPDFTLCFPLSGRFFLQLPPACGIVFAIRS